MLICTFEIPANKISTVRAFTLYLKDQYKAQTIYYAKTHVLEVKVESIYYNHVINTALAYGYLILHS